MKIGLKNIHDSQIIRFVLISVALIFIIIPASHAQIVFEHSFNFSGNIAKLEKEGQKFYVMDDAINECRIYNLDYSLFKTVKLDVPSGDYLYDIQYVTQNLFDMDDSIELLFVFYQYVQTTTSYYYIYTTRVADENGTILADLPGGSWTEIMNISGSGSRMLTYITDYSSFPYSVETRIYRLPGQISSAAKVMASPAEGNGIFPNPTTGSIQMAPGGFQLSDKAEWVILDSSGKLIARQPVTGPAIPVDLKSLGLVAGIYMVRLESKNYQTKFQQVVLNN